MNTIKIAQAGCNIAVLFVGVTLVSCTPGGIVLHDATPPAISSASPADSAAGVTVSNAQEGMSRRDTKAATHSDAVSRPGFSFTRVTGGCVLDNVTGLMWEVKTTDGGLHDWGKLFTNFDNTTELQKLDRANYLRTYVAPTQAEIDAPTNSVGYKNNVNAQGVCGYSDWRLPTIEEIQTIMDFNAEMDLNAKYPVRIVDENWFPNTQYSMAWSSTPVVGKPTHAWYVMFNEGAVYDDVRWASAFVRLVRTHK